MEAKRLSLTFPCVLVLVATVLNIVSGQYPCAPGFYRFNAAGKCYGIVPQLIGRPVDWLQSRDICSRVVNNGSPVVIESAQQEQDILQALNASPLQQLVQRCRAVNSAQARYYTAGRRASCASPFMWMPFANGQGTRPAAAFINAIGCGSSADNNCLAITNQPVNGRLAYFAQTCGSGPDQPTCVFCQH